MKPLVSIQILNWNRAQDTLRAIDSAKEQTYSNIEIVFVDNGSDDNSVELVKQNHPDVIVVQLDKNYGCPEGRNKGVEFCNGEFIFYLDNDGVLHKDAVQKAYDLISKDDQIAVVAGMVYDFKDPSEIDTSIKPRSNKIYPHYNFQGGICMHRKSIYDTVGMYPSHFMYGGEEWYLTAKILDNGLKIVRDESIILWHIQSETARNREKETLNAYYNKLYGSINLYPAQYAFAFAVYFPLQYLKYAKKANIDKVYKKTFLKRYFNTIRMGFKTRSPIGLKAYKQLMRKE